MLKKLLFIGFLLFTVLSQNVQTKENFDTETFVKNAFFNASFVYTLTPNSEFIVSTTDTSNIDCGDNKQITIEILNTEQEHNEC